MPNLVVEDEGDSQSDSWRDDYLQQSSSGLTCKTCYALVAAMAPFALKHTAWHESRGEKEPTSGAVDGL